MKEELWIAEQQSRALLEFRAGLRGVWADDAAREINGRFLTPHEDDDVAMREAFNLQTEMLDAATERLKEAEHLMEEATRLSEQVTNLLENIRQDVRNAYAHQESCAHFIEDANRKFQVAAWHIEQANEAG